MAQPTLLRPAATSHDVIVIGAGFSGLSAALSLMQNGLDVMVLEARMRVGGRVERSENALGEPVDVGGQYFCTDMKAITALAGDHGLDLVQGLQDGRHIRLDDRPDADLADGSASPSTDLRTRVRRLLPDDPALRGLSVTDWVAQQGDSSEDRAAFIGLVEGLWCQPAERLPIWYLASNDRRNTNTVSELQYYPTGTLHGLASRLGDELGSRLRLGEPVDKVFRDSRGVTVWSDQRAYAAQHAIVAVPPVMARRLTYDPPLPEDTSGALASWESGSVFKAHLRYDKAFWRAEDVASVSALSLPGFFACDSSRSGAEPSLVAFVGGSLCIDTRRKGPEALTTLVLDTLARALGPQALKPLSITARDWTGDLWSGGAYSDTIMDLVSSDAEDVLRRGLPRIAFACSELAPQFPGYVEGALLAGRAAAARIIGTQQATGR